MDLCSHSGLLTKVLQETIGGQTVDGQHRKWWMVEQSGKLISLPTSSDTQADVI